LLSERLALLRPEWPVTQIRRINPAFFTIDETIPAVTA
jgi:hypothetical protein